MLPLLLHTFTSVCVVAATAVATETVVGVAGRTAALPCRLEAAKQKDVDVCWGRGEPSLFTCHNAVLHVAGEQVSYRKSNRYSVSSSSSLHILMSRPSDSGFYHCRVQLPGLFNDQMSIIHLIIISPRSVLPDSSSQRSSERSGSQEAGDLNAPRPTAGRGVADATQTGSDVNTTGPVAAQVQSPVQQVNGLELFIGNTVRLSFIIFIPALLLTVAYRVRRSGRRSDPDRSLEDGLTSTDRSH